MNINMKYYVVTIGAIFLALGVGIIVGFNLNNDQELSKQQSEVLGQFEEKFDSLTEEKKQLTQRVEYLEEESVKLQDYISKYYTFLINNELSEKNTGIILTNEKNDYSEDIENLIQDANGNVAFNIILKDAVEDEETLNTLSKQLNKEIKTSQDCINYIVDVLNTKSAKTDLNELENLGIIEVKSLNSNYITYESVVLIGENEDENLEKSFEVKDKNLISKLKNEKKYIVAVQRESSKSQFVKLCSELKISTIDNIDGKIGKVSLAMLIKDESKIGNFGVGEDVESLMPFSK